MKVKGVIKNQIKNIANKLEVDIVKKKNLDFKKNFDLSQLDLACTNILNNYNLGDLITTAGKRLGSDEDPYFFALNSSLPINSKDIFVKHFIKAIKSIVKRPRNAAEAIGITNSKDLEKYPEWALVLPWDNLTIDQNYKIYLKKFLSKRKKLESLYQSSLEKKEDIIYSDDAWKSHAEQFFELYNSISSEGFKDIDLIPVNLFKYNDLYRVSLSDDGNHRVRVAYVLGHKSIPFKIAKLVDFQSINNWQNVKNGLYSKTDAKEIFINYFNYSGKGTYV